MGKNLLCYFPSDHRYISDDFNTNRWGGVADCTGLSAAGCGLFAALCGAKRFDDLGRASIRARAIAMCTKRAITDAKPVLLWAQPPLCCA